MYEGSSFSITLETPVIVCRFDYSHSSECEVYLDLVKFLSPWALTSPSFGLGVHGAYIDTKWVLCHLLPLQQQGHPKAGGERQVTWG